eukprot:CAMPEP_0117883950 /NCGR_PEP_ID=MMETSP0950-20121206/18521_1 /TAXON_ID=44440 /ORGANISM="Chattonella subsalsa, Strain CCMP2191" /LENGTH=655 /DNA_ID=CAMNT_0005740087 /DNA_START=249 /DNA_END=2215 /DNA_ORIENTATION=+
MAEVYSPLINDKYRISRKLGGGSFGDIYLAIGTNGEKVAVKFEKHTTRCPQLRHEYKVYREMQGATGFGRVHYFGTHDNYNVMVMDLLGPSLEDLFNKCGRRFSLKTVLQLADQMLERIETMHSRHLIHRDVKPANFVLGGSRNPNICFCIDFGLSTRYRHPRTLQHIPFREGRSLTGTPRYASINNHLGMEQSRRDDLESIGYVLIYFLKGSLPWQGLKARNAKRKYKMIMEKKQSVPIAQLCQGLPQQFAEYLAYCRSLKFDAKPNISYLRGLFRELYRSQGYSAELGLEWDWSKIENAVPQEESSEVGKAEEPEQNGQAQVTSKVEPSAYNSHLGETTAARLGSTYGHDVQGGLHSTPGTERKFDSTADTPLGLTKPGTPGGSRANSQTGKTPRLLGNGSQGSRPQVDSTGAGAGVSAPPLGVGSGGHPQRQQSAAGSDSRSGGRRSASQGAAAVRGGAGSGGYDHLPSATGTPKNGEDWRGKESGGAWSGRIFGGRAQSAQHSRPHTAHGLRTQQGGSNSGPVVGSARGVLQYSRGGSTQNMERQRAVSAEQQGGSGVVGQYQGQQQRASTSSGSRPKFGTVSNHGQGGQQGQVKEGFLLFKLGEVKGVTSSVLLRKWELPTYRWKWKQRSPRGAFKGTLFLHGGEAKFSK